MKIGYLMVGVSGSGKSTVVNELTKLHQNAAVFSLDKCRLELFKMQSAISMSDAELYAGAFEYATKYQQQFDSFVTSSWKSALEQDVVIVDNTNLTRKGRARWCNEMHDKGFNVIGVSVSAPLQVVLDRQSTRGDKSVPAKIVREMYMRQQELFVGSEVDEILHVDGTHAPVIFHSGNFAE